jgi:hypothetical protein
MSVNWKRKVLCLIAISHVPVIWRTAKISTRCSTAVIYSMSKKSVNLFCQRPAIRLCYAVLYTQCSTLLFNLRTHAALITKTDLWSQSRDYICISFYILMTVHRVMILGKWPTWRTILYRVFIFNSLHVSSTSCSSSGETNCVSTTSGNCHSVSLTMSCAGRKYMVKNCASRWSFTKNCTLCFLVLYFLCFIFWCWHFRLYTLDVVGW